MQCLYYTFQGKTVKYTEYSSLTGITRSEGQSIANAFDQSSLCTAVTDKQHDRQTENWWHRTMAMVVEFRDERNWSQFHTPRNICLSITCELGELADVLQFENDDATEITTTKCDQLMQEIADVAIYSISLTQLLLSADESNESTRQIMYLIKEII